MERQLTWGKHEHSLKVFVSSPGDVDRERASVRRVIEDINRSLGTKLGIFLRLEDWHKFRPAGVSVEEFVKRQLEDCDLFIMIFNRRFGSPPSARSRYRSGTVMEYELACDLREASGNKRPEIFAYFKEITDRAVLRDPGAELSKVLKFQKRLKDTLFYKKYQRAEVFPFELKDHITEWLFEIAETIKLKDVVKRNVLRRFFDLGSTAGNSSSSSLIIYPPSTQVSADPTHLLPYMILEDFQAIHKLVKCLNVAGYQEVHSCSVNLFESKREKHQNKFFLCLPRNRPGQQALKEHDDARFRVTYQSRSGSKIIWKSKSGDEIEVASPQSTYLLKQRESLDSERNPGKYVAVDFAILARFDDCHSGFEDLRQFFVFGIRGLGTWGAAWYLDRCYGELQDKVPTEGSIQLLLKITYRNHRIASVEDVSHQTQAFFRSENDPDQIESRLRTVD
ncbi:MAG: DUF4062 domain-containing protein [Acidobacteriota bacterium]